MSAAGTQLRLPVSIPIDPRVLAEADIEPIERGYLFNALQLDSWQRQAVEEARRMVLAGTYPGSGR